MSERDALEQCGTQGHREDDSTGSFERVEDKSEDAEGGRFAGDIGSADVPAAGLADVFAAKDANEEIAERDRSQKIAAN